MLKRKLLLNIIILFSITFTGYVHSAEVFDYTIEQLFEPCLEGDSDSRWGEPSRTKCEQYIIGFTDAYILHGLDKKDNVCLPTANRPAEIRWAFMRWTQRNYKDRHQPAAQGLSAAIKSEFACE